MGNTPSRNISNITARVIAKVATNIIASNVVSIDESSHLVSINSDSPSINMKGMIYNQTVILNGKELLSQLSTESAQEQLIESMTHSVKCVSDAINLNGDSYVKSITNSYLNASLYIINNIQIICSQVMSDNWLIWINNNNGIINITNATMCQLTKLFYDSVVNSLATNVASQELQKMIENSNRFL
jgi:hypothetical protein